MGTCYEDAPNLDRVNLPQGVNLPTPPGARMEKGLLREACPDEAGFVCNDDKLNPIACSEL